MDFILFIAVILFVLFMLNSLFKKGAKAALKKYRDQFDERKSKIKLHPERTMVAGVRYDNDDGTSRQKIIKKLKVGEDLILERDTSNKFDDSAVKVCRVSEEQFGFLEMDIAVEINARLKEGSRVDAQVISINTIGKFKEVEIQLTKHSRRVK